MIIELYNAHNLYIPTKYSKKPLSLLGFSNESCNYIYIFTDTVTSKLLFSLFS